MYIVHTPHWFIPNNLAEWTERQVVASLPFSMTLKTVIGSANSITFSTENDTVRESSRPTMIPPSSCPHSAIKWHSSGTRDGQLTVKQEHILHSNYITLLEIQHVCMYVNVCVHVCACMHVCMYVCMYVCMHLYVCTVCMYVCMYVCTVWMDGWMDGWVGRGLHLPKPIEQFCQNSKRILLNFQKFILNFTHGVRSSVQIKSEHCTYVE